METESVISAARLVDPVELSTVETIGFFQVVRLLESSLAKNSEKELVGYDSFPEREIAAFMGSQQLLFPDAEIEKIEVTVDGRADVTAQFFGLTGTAGALPIHYTEWLQQQKRHNDDSMREFFNIFNNRSVALFYRAWKKYRLPFLNESALAKEDVIGDPITQAIFSLIGLQPKYTAFLHRLPVRSALYFAGFFTGRARNAKSLGKMLSEYLDEEVSVRSMCGEWLDIDEDDRSILPDSFGRGSNHCLGVDFVVGDRVFCIENKFEIDIGPIARERIDRYGPGSAKQKEVAELCGLYVGCSFQFDIRYRLEAEHRPEWTVEDTQLMFKLGWNTWLPQDKNNRSVFDEIVVPYSGLN